MKLTKEIVLTTINAKWIHSSLALRLLKANLGSLENSCEIIEFALRQPLAEKLEPFASACAGGTPPKILGISVSIWNHLATIELLKELEKIFAGASGAKPIIILGGPEVSHLPEDAEIFKYANHVVKGEGEIAFCKLCEKLLKEDITLRHQEHKEHKEEEGLKSAYYLYTDDDVKKKLIYVESSRGCAFNCDFCLSALENKIYEFPLDQFLSEMDILIQRGVKTFKFLDRSFNLNIPRALQIIEFFLGKIESFLSSSVSPCPRERSFVILFEMVPSLLTPELMQALSRFPPGTLRLEIGIQTLNPQVSARINRPSNPEKELEALRLLRENTNAIIHADLIAGLPGEDLASFGSGFDKLWWAICNKQKNAEINDNCHVEIQLGILKKLPGAPIARHDNEFKMRYNHLPPYDIEETSVLSAEEIIRIKNFARFWEILVNRGLIKPENGTIFNKFMQLSDKLFSHFGRNWGIDKDELIVFVKNNSSNIVHFKN